MHESLINKKILIYAIGFCLFLVGLFLWVLWATPSYIDIKKRAMGSDRYLLSSDLQLIQQQRSDFRKRRLAWLPISSYSQNLTKAVVLVEDQRFYYHWGVDIRGLLRAAKVRFQEGRRQGGSTLTMQLCNLIQREVLEGGRPIQRGHIYYKARQILCALGIDAKWSKDEILESYFNLIHLRGESQGFQTFTRSYWQKSPTYLNLTEALILANLIRSPNRSIEKFATVVCEQGKKLKTDYDCESFAHDSQPRPASSQNSGEELAPHFLRKLISLGLNENMMKSYINPSIQAEVQKILEKNLSSLQSHNVHDMAAVVLDNKTGQVLAYVGSVPRYSQSPDVDGADSPRSVGSTLKPFFYGKAIEEKVITAASIIEDEPAAISWSGGLYRPTNYDKKFHGSVTVRQALASSLNVPAVKVIKILGLSDSYQMLKRMHISDLKPPDFYGASIALGAIDIRLHELANAFRALANKGQWSPLMWSPDLPVAAPADAQDRLLSEESAFIISDILADPNARRIGFHWDSALETSFWTAVKTGTSKDIRDNWCMGYSNDYTVGVWAGNFSSERMTGVSGVTGAGPSWNEIMGFLHREKRSAPPAQPSGVVQKKIQMPKVGEISEYFIQGTEPQRGFIQISPRTGVSFLFPIDGTTLVRNPHRKNMQQNIFVRYKGNAPAGCELFLDDKKLGPLKNPFKVVDLPAGQHHFAIKNAAGEILDEVRFTLK